MEVLISMIIGFYLGFAISWIIRLMIINKRNDGCLYLTHVPGESPQVKWVLNLKIDPDNPDIKSGKTIFIKVMKDS